MFDKFQRADSLARQEKLRLLQERKRQCKENLTKSVETKIRTTFIGSLDAVEKHLGTLWGYGLPREDLNEAEIQFLSLWQSLRDDILNRGNAQLRAALAELSKYDVDVTRLPYKLEIKLNNDQTT